MRLPWREGDIQYFLSKGRTDKLTARKPMQAKGLFKYVISVMKVGCILLAAAGIARRLQLKKSCKGRQHGPSLTVQITPAGPLSSTSAGQDDVLGQCSIRSSASVHTPVRLNVQSSLYCTSVSVHSSIQVW
jgi:hypothetical protein